LVHAFPELAALVNNISVGWVLELMFRYPTARLLAAANDSDLADVPYLQQDMIPKLLANARSSIASLEGELEEEVVRDQIRQIRDADARKKRMENLLVQAYRRLPTANHLDSIKGFGEVTAPVLTAVIRDINRFETANSLVKYFGVLPIEASSGTERDGSTRRPKRFVMSKAGNDLVRRYLWMAALSAVCYNPAVRPLYQRVIAKHPKENGIAIGHVMRKLLHLAFAVWKTGTPFDPDHYPWEKPAHVPGSIAPRPAAQARPCVKENQAAGHTESAKPAEKVVTAACEEIVPQPAPAVASPTEQPSISDDAFLDFTHIKRQLPMTRVLEHLGLMDRLRGSGAQRRRACPIHQGDGRGRTFSVNLDENVFSCHKCKAKGDVIDLWAAIHRQALRPAALDLVRTFGLEPSPRTRTEKRTG
jgi:hypothetical protein